MSGDEPLIILGPILDFLLIAGIFALLFFFIKRLPRRVHRASTICLYVILAVSTGAFGIYIWPTPWHNWATHDFDYRTNRVTGKIEVQSGSGWIPDPKETERAIQRNDQTDDYGTR